MIPSAAVVTSHETPHSDSEELNLDNMQRLSVLLWLFVSQDIFSLCPLGCPSVSLSLFWRLESKCWHYGTQVVLGLHRSTLDQHTHTHTQVYINVQQVRADRWSQSGSSFSWITWCVSSVVFPSAAGWLKLSLQVLIVRALLSNGPLYWSSSEAFTVQSDVVCSVFTVSYSWGPVLQHGLDVLSFFVKQGCMFPLRTPLISSVTSADMAVGLCSLSNQPRDYWWGRTVSQNVCVFVTSHTNQNYRPMAASCYKADLAECVIAVHLQPSLGAFCAVVCASVWLLLMVETHCLLPEGSANISPTEDSESGLLSASFNNKPRRDWCCLSRMETVELWGGFLWFKMNDQTV